MLKTDVLLNIFVETEIFGNNEKVFTFTFDQFNASLLNKTIKKRSFTDPKLLSGNVCFIYSS